MAGPRDVISIDRLREHLRSIHFDRNPEDHYLELEQAAQYIRMEFVKWGWETQEDPFPWNGRVYKNIVAEKRGGAFPQKVFLLGAHYDTVQGSPGADDNASSIAVLLEVARNLQKLPLNATVRLIAFCLEEVDYAGSTHYAERAKEEGEEILGMIALEMVGFTAVRQDYPPYVDRKLYPTVGDFIAIVGNDRSKRLLERVRSSFKGSATQLPVASLVVPGNGEGMGEVRLSDHSPFWDRGFPALLVTDTAFLRNPNYHLPTDTIETIDFEFMRRVALGIYSSILELAK